MIQINKSPAFGFSNLTDFSYCILHSHMQLNISVD